MKPPQRRMTIRGHLLFASVEVVLGRMILVSGSQRFGNLDCFMGEWSGIPTFRSTSLYLRVGAFVSTRKRTRTPKWLGTCPSVTLARLFAPCARFVELDLLQRGTCALANLISRITQQDLGFEARGVRPAWFEVFQTTIGSRPQVSLGAESLLRRQARVSSLPAA